MDLTSISDLQTAMKLAGIKPNKGLGQHFLVDKPSLEAIMAAAELDETDTVLEIGPGLGVMTTPLAAQVRAVVAVETDQTLSAILRRASVPNLTVVESDILAYDFTTLPADYKVVANIPYYLTSKIIRLLMESANPPAVASLLIQKEVAERIVARPGQMSILALSVQYYAEVELVRVVERHKFWPSPEVDSAVLLITRRSEPAFAADPHKLFRLIKAGFGEKRKQLKNSLAGAFNVNSTAVVAALEAAELGPTARAQELSLEQWGRLYNVVYDLGWLS